MARIIKSDAFSGGYAAYSPIDADEAWMLDHANLKIAVSGSGLAMRSIDNLWDDLADPDLTYRPAGTLDTGAVPSTEINGRPSIRIPGGAAGRLIGNVAMPASYTVFSAFQLDNPASGATKVILGSAASAFPRFAMSVSATGTPTLAHNAPPSAIGIALVLSAATPYVLWGSYDATTKAAELGLNSTSRNGVVTFTDDHVPGATIGIGAMGDGGSPMVGDIGGIFVFNSVLSTDDRARVLRWMSRRYGVAVTGV